jgi:hypothetical protein
MEGDDGVVRLNGVGDDDADLVEEVDISVSESKGKGKEKSCKTTSSQKNSVE